MLTDLTVLITGGGMFQGLGLLRSLRASGRIRVVVADCFEENVTRHFADGWKRVPEAKDAPAFLEAVLAAALDEGARLVIPATAHDLAVLALARARFASHGVHVAVSDPGLVELCDDKAALVRALASAGLPVLEAVDPEAATLPLIGKPAGGFGGRGVLVLRTQADRDRARGDGALPGRLWQRFLPACEELSADFAIGVDAVPSAVGLRRRVRTSGGFAVVSDDVALPLAGEVVPRTVEWLRARGGRGLINVQFLVDQSQTGVYVSDVNLRIGTSAVQWARPGGANPALHLCASVEPRLRAAPPATTGLPQRVVRGLAETRIELDPEHERREARVEAVVFDLDDTLVDHKAWILDKAEGLAEVAGAPARAELRRQALRLVEEGAAPRLVDALADALGLVGRRDELLARYRSARPARCRVHDDVAPTLETLRRRGYRLALLTDNPPESQRLKLEVSGLGGAFDEIVFAREAGAEKPAGIGFETVARRLGLAPSALAMVGDDPWRDIAGAAGAGYGVAYLVRRAGGLRSFDERLFRGACPELRFRTLDGLQPLLNFLPGRGAPGAQGPAPP